MVELLSLFGAFLAIEGALYAGAPEFARKMAFEISQMEPDRLRKAGLVALTVGVGLVWLVRG